MAKSSGGVRQNAGGSAIYADRRTSAEKRNPYNAIMQLDLDGNTRYISKRFKTEDEANKWNENVENRFLFKKGYTVMSSTIEKILKNGREESISFLDLSDILYNQKAYRNKTGFYKNR